MKLVKLIKMFRRSADVPHFKNTAENTSVRMPAPSLIILPMQQHIGEPCKPVVKAGDKVAAGQLVGDSDAFISVPIHASVSGEVKAVLPDAVHIENDDKDTLHSEIKKPEINNREDFLRAVRQSGTVGLGGAGFPTHVKLTLKEGANPMLIINGAECEPYITADYREIMENCSSILSGIEQVVKWLEIGSCIIGIEDNKPKAIALLKNEIVARNMQCRVSVVELPARYPYGAEKILVRAVTGRTIPAGGLPGDVGAVVLNISTVSSLGHYFDTGVPLIQKRVTVAGGAVANPQNVLVPMGTPIRSVLDFCGGCVQEPEKIILGGPMMGVAQQDCEAPVTRQNNAILCLTVKETYPQQDQSCIRCGRCSQVCPMNLTPVHIERNANKGNAVALGKLGVSACMECGCCAFACPARRALVQSMLKGKQVQREIVGKNA